MKPYRLGVLLGLLLLAGIHGCAGQGQEAEGSSVRYLLEDQWGTSGEEPGQFREPMGIAVDNEGNVYVADARNQRVQKFTPQGEFLVTYGTPGTGPGQFEKPVDVAVDADGAVYVSDYGYCAHSSVNTR